ncbi:Lactose transport system permease protein LacF [Pseudooceanicola marinus]|uniref:Lactose transport system permease protein LacF n=1 Tax=Pseudooceanicola marinus TaxID=396013 RepID=A0A1X6Z468_9RHOB|nr:sugar ABC transporter permease [Pseudooceanicola marinus]SLN39966.1 Lactose transport system permease protein LacF [Pseudooceanicola marinus]
MLRKLTSYLFILPLMAFLAVFTYVPILQSVNLSFRGWDFMSPMKSWAGLENDQLLLSTRDFWNAVKVTTIFAVISVPLRLALAIASYLVRETIVSRVMRGALFLPSVTSTVSIAVVFSRVFSTDYGMIHAGLAWLGIERVQWMQNPQLALYVLGRRRAAVPRLPAGDPAAGDAHHLLPAVGLCHRRLSRFSPSSTS